MVGWLTAVEMRVLRSGIDLNVGTFNSLKTHLNVASEKALLTSGNGRIMRKN